MTTRQAIRQAIAACREVEVVYGHDDTAVQALGGVSFEIHPGESLALLGRSGSGKTTVLHALGGLIEPTAGSVEWHGLPLASLDRAARGAVRAHGIGYVFQGANLLPHFTAFENVAFAAHLVSERGKPQDPGDLLELIGLADKADHLPAELSGGEAQRVAVARALAQGPKLLLCDEPTGHLDSDTGERVLDLIDALQAEFGFSLVIATHDSDVSARAGRELELDDGLIVRDEAR